MNRFKDAYAQAALMGLALYGVGVLIFAVAIVIYDVAEAYFLVFFALPGLIVAAALWFWKRWGLLVAILGSIIGIMFLSEDADVSLTTLKGFFDFSATWFGIVGLLIVLIASVIGTIQYFRKQPSPALGSTTAMAIKGIGAAIAVLAVVSLVVTVLNTGDASASDAQGAQRITAKHTSWNVETVTVAPGDVKLVVRNSDPLLHSFTIRDLDIDVILGPWSEEVVVLEGLTPGNYGFICRLFSHESDMTGVITVR